MHILFYPVCDGENTIQVEDEDFRHLQVLRIKLGEEIKISDNIKYVYKGKIEQITKKAVTISVYDKTPIAKSHNLILLQALCKGEKNEFIIQKATELGVDKIMFFTSKNCVVRENEKTQSKIIRYNKIAKEASMQCGRQLTPIVEGVISFKNAVGILRGSANPLFFYENGKTLFSKYLAQKNKYESFTFMIGSEGGFTSEESEIIENADVPILSLGTRILRAETASLAVLSIILFCFGEI